MAPSKQKSNENMKQKSLMGWLGKPPTEKKEKPQPPKPAAAIANIGASKSGNINPTTPERKNSNILEEKGSSGARSEMSRSSVGLGEMQTPPTSDLIDVDMLSDVEEECAITKPVGTYHSVL